MLVVLSQKVDTESTYNDELFETYHYPARYKHQLHEGDVFIYYQANRFDKSLRYYFGVGTVGKILTMDGENYYAKLLDGQQFRKTVPIHLPDGGYIEQLGYRTVRKSINPPWQSSIRPLSQEAFDYILKAADIQTVPNTTVASVDDLKEKLKCSIRDFFVENDLSAIHRIESISAAIGRSLSIGDNLSKSTEEDMQCQPVVKPHDKLKSFMDYCRTMKMSFSYKPILIISLLHTDGNSGDMTIDNAVQYFRDYYNDRRKRGLQIEKKNCIYQRQDITDQQIKRNIVANPVRVLVKSGFFIYNEKANVFSITPEIWNVIDRKSKAVIIGICNQKLKEYYGE